MDSITNDINVVFFYCCLSLFVAGNATYIPIMFDFLTELSRKINQIDTNCSLSSKRSTTGTEIYPQRMQQKSIIKTYGDVDAATKTKILEIEHLMTACYPIDYVIRVIPALLKRYEISGDLSSLNEALDRHRHNAEMYIKRYMYR
jgi:hypothetical protein